MHVVWNLAGNESEVPETQISPEVRSVCGSNAAESAASVAELSFPSSDGATCSGSKPERFQVQFLGMAR